MLGEEKKGVNGGFFAHLHASSLLVKPHTMRFLTWSRLYYIKTPAWVRKGINLFCIVHTIQYLGTVLSYNGYVFKHLNRER